MFVYREKVQFVSRSSFITYFAAVRPEQYFDGVQRQQLFVSSLQRVFELKPIRSTCIL